MAKDPDNVVDIFRKRNTLLSILGRANSEHNQQAGFWATHKAIERARQARVRAQRARREGS